MFDGLRWGWGQRLPMILQTESTECGLACLTMIARYHGHDVDLASLRHKYPTSARGANLKQIMATAADLGFTTRALRLDLPGLPSLATPCILHWGMNHFVVLQRANSRSSVIYDPAHGVRKISNADLSKQFTGVALEATPGTDFKPIKARESISLRSLTGKVKGLPGALLQVFVLALVLELFALLGPFYLQWVMDQVLVSADRSVLTLIATGFLLLTIFQAAFSAVRAWTIIWLGSMLNVQWITGVFSHLLRLPMDWYEKRHVGDVVSRFGSLQAIQHTFTTDFVAAILDGILASLTLVVLALYSIKLSLIVGAAFGLYALLRWFTYQPFRNTQENQIVSAARQETELLESIRGAQTIKLNNLQQLRNTRYANAVVETVNRNVAMERLKIAFTTGNDLIFGIEKIALVWLAAILVLDGTFTAGMLIAFVAYADQFVTRAASLVDKGIQFRILRLHAERVADIACTEPEPHVESTWDTSLPEATIEVRNVSFRYSKDEPWILNDCSFAIELGDSMALAGPSGCGKTTLAKIILGLLEPEKGEVLYGGVNIRKLGLARYRNQVGAVMQDDQLFAGSIAENIACFDPESTREQIEASARLASIHETIVAMPMAYQSLVGDMGSVLSGGQKQRLLLARALYRHPTLLVLDEATSHLDVECERQVNAVINEMQITRIIIAHRPETLASARHVLRMEDGATIPMLAHPLHTEVAG